MTPNPMQWETMQPRVDALLAVELTQENVGDWLREWSDLTALLYEAHAQVYREVSENTADEEADKRFHHLMDEILPKSQVAEQALKEKFLAFKEYQPTDETEQMVKRFRTEAAIYRDENVPLISELLKLGNEYDKLVGGMTIEWDGVTETLPQADLHLQDRDRATRERAWRLIMASFLNVREQLNALYLKMLAVRHQVAINAGFENFRDYQWQAYARFDYSPADNQTFHDAIEHEVVPLATQHQAWLRDQLGLESLRPWDEKMDPYEAPLTPFKDAAELEEIGHRIFQRVDPVLGDHFALMRDGYLDLASRPNKAPGGYCNEFPASGRPYIFMNAVGTHLDVNTLMHEGGHAFHVLEARDQALVWNHYPPTEFCEVASMAMEYLSLPYLNREDGGFYDDNDTRRAYRKQLMEGAILFLPYMAVVDAFQHWVYTQPPTDLTAADLDAKWCELWDRYLPGVDYSGLQAEKETGWHRKVHIFTYPMYYVEYGLAQLGALQVWRNALRDQAQAVADYRAALALGATRSLPELFTTAGATFAFDRPTIGSLMALVREQLERLDQHPN